MRSWPQRVASVRGGGGGGMGGGDGGEGGRVGCTGGGARSGKVVSKCDAGESGRVLTRVERSLARSLFVARSHFVKGHMGLRGGAGIPDWVAALLPTSYDSTSAWWV